MRWASFVVRTGDRWERRQDRAGGETRSALGSLLALAFIALAGGCASEVGVAERGERCVRSAECVSGLACVAGECTDDLSALEGGTLPPVPVDAGPEPDAGPGGDAGPDAGPIDAGSPDAGAIDAGPVDAGPTDAGPPDAGRPDAGPPDAGPPDGGPPDAGPISTPDAGPMIDAGGA